MGTPVTFGWDIVRGIAIDEVSIPDVPTGDSGGGGALTYFLTIDGLNGGSLNKEHPGAFEIDGFDFDVSALAGGKGSDDLLVFSPLTIDLILNSGLTALLGDVTGGKPIPSIRIEGIVRTPDATQTVYDLRLGDVVVTKVHDSSGDQDHLTFDYSQVSLTTTPLSDTGTLGIHARSIGRSPTLTRHRRWHWQGRPRLLLRISTQAAG